jgi:hypothetical protein
MAHSSHTINMSQDHFAEFDILESLAGFWVIRTVGDRVQLVDRFVERVDAERFLEYLAWQAGRVFSGRAA